MRVYKEIPDNPELFYLPILTIGSFDGVHSGHRRIILTLMNLAKEKKADPVVLTFNTHPRKVLTPGTPPKILTTEREKIKAIEDCGVKNIIMLDFTEEVADMRAIEFYNEMIVKKIGMVDLVVGYDHAFGKNRDGDFDFLKEFSKMKGFEITRVKPEDFHARPISSTWIRAEIEDGNIAFANSLLSRRYTLFGSVVKGVGRGRKLNFPTANVIPEDSDKIIPKDGVYAVTVIIDKSIQKDGMLNIGTNPTFSNTERTIEVNIFDFDKDIYDEIIEIDFYDRIRSEMKFSSPDALVEQLKKDKITVQEILRNDAGIHTK